jgi:hypothetical protein
MNTAWYDGMLGEGDGREHPRARADPAAEEKARAEAEKAAEEKNKKG